LALHSIYSLKGSFDLWRQWLADDVGIEAAKVLADGAQKFFVRHHRNPLPSLGTACHHHPQITYLVDVAGH
jgi:hypothetical protein